MVQEIVHRVAKAIWEEMMPEMISPINTAAAWSAIADGFEKCWQFPHCCGALDGKHCDIQCPPPQYWISILELQ